MRISTALKCDPLTMLFPIRNLLRVWFVFMPLLACAQSVPYSYSGAVNPPFNSTVRFILDQSGTFTNFVDQSFSGVQQAFQVSIDPTALSVRFDEFRLTTASTTFSRTEAVTVGLGQTKTFSLSLTINPMTFSWGEPSQTHSLTAGSGGDYVVGGVEPGLSAFSGSGTMTGSYTITGPTQTVNNTFSISLGLDPSNSGGFVGNRIGTMGYPGSITVGSSTDSPTFYVANFITGATARFINETVDGVSISTGISRIYSSGITDSSGSRLSFTPGSLASGAEQQPSIPEPNTYAALAGGIVFVFAAITLRRARHPDVTEGSSPDP